MKRVSITIMGKVTGVFFRAHVRDLAKELGIKGYVQNTPDDCLLIVAEGEEKAIERLVYFCKKGPEGAIVENMKVKREGFKNEFEDFLIEY
ncbi:acylphosphatase [Candidatus Woesearchaeota archaeon]|nr:acylphosphatase [Candidatus Woesearchaeota archaeon]